MSPTQARRCLAWTSLVALGLTWLMLVPEHAAWTAYDWQHLHVFYKEFYRSKLLAGGLPQWNPYIALGRPFLADIEVAAFYPPNLLFLAGTGLGLGLSLWFHFSLALLGMLRLSRQLGCRELAGAFAALAFVLGAPLLARLQSGQIQVFCALCWLPWVFATANDVVAAPGGRSAVRFVLNASLFFLAGSPTIFWVGAWGVLAGLIFRLSLARPPTGTWRGVAWLALGVLLAAGVVSVQSLPFLELVAQGNRGGRELAFALDNNQPAQIAWSLLRPRLSGGFFYWEYNLFSGVLVVVLAGLGLGRQRPPEVVALSLLAAVFLILALGAATPVLPALAAHAPGWGSFRYPSRYGIITAFALCLLAGHGIEQLARRAAAGGISVRLGRSIPWLLGGLLAINVVDTTRAFLDRAGLYSDGGPFSAAREEELTKELKAAGQLAPGRPPPRVLAPPWIVREDSGLLHGYTTLSGFANPFVGRVWNELHLAAGVTPSVLDPVNLPLRMYATPPVPFTDLEIAARWDPRDERFVISSTPSRRFHLEPQTTEARVFLEKYEDDQLLLHTRSPGTSMLVVGEPWYPGWQATVDGRPVEVKLTQGWMRAIQIPAGEHAVKLTFRSRWLMLGGAISMFSLGFAAWLWRRSTPAA